MMFSFLIFRLWIEADVIAFVAQSIFLGYIVSQLAFLAHDALHGAISRSKGINEVFGHISMTICAGMGFREWKDRHLKHHRYCQNAEKDPDMDIGYIASVTRESYL